MNASTKSPVRKLFATALLGLSLAGSAAASVSFVASGYNPETGNNGQSAEADIKLVGNELTLTLSNTTGVTKAQGDALTGVLFNLSKKNVELELESVSLTAGSNLWTSGSKTNDSKNLWGSWTDKLADHPRIPASFGVATTGFNGEFNGNMELGNGGPDYGILGEDTLPGTINGSRYPFAQNSLTFKFKVESGSLSESDFSGASFLFGTNGQGWLKGSLVPTGGGSFGDNGGGNAPEPASFLLLGVAVAAARFTRRAR